MNRGCLARWRDRLEPTSKIRTRNGVLLLVCFRHERQLNFSLGWLCAADSEVRRDSFITHTVTSTLTPVAARSSVDLSVGSRAALYRRNDRTIVPHNFFDEHLEVLCVGRVRADVARLHEIYERTVTHVRSLQAVQAATHTISWTTSTRRIDKLLEML